MKFFASLIVCLGLYSSLKAQSIEWVQTAGNSGYNIALTSKTCASGLVIGGWFDNSLIFGTDTVSSFGGADGYISILDNAGAFTGSIAWGGNAFDATTAVESADNALIIAGETTSSTYEILGNAYDRVSVSQDVFLAKIDTGLNNVVWMINDFNNGTLNFNTSLSTKGDLINISGFYGSFETRMYNSNGQFAWSEEFPTSNSILSTLDSGSAYVVIDSFDIEIVNGIPQGGVYKYKLHKYDLQGNLQEKADIFNAVTPDPGGTFDISSVEVDDMGNTIISGTFEEPLEFNGVVYDPGQERSGFILKLDSSLDPEWFRSVGGTQPGWLEVASTDDSYWLGWSEENDMGNSSVFHLDHYDPEGNMESAFELVSSHSVIGYDLEVTHNSIFMSGMFKGQLNIQNQLYNSTGIFDILVMKFDDPVLGTGLSDPSSNYRISFFPNPLKDILSIKSEYPLESVKVFDLLGRLRLQKEGLNTNNYELNVSELSRGQYVLLINNGRFISEKIVKE